MNKAKAQKLVEVELAKMSNAPNSIECAILTDETIEKSWGWVFFYQSADFIRTGNFRDMVVGNAPFIVNRQTGEIIETGTAYDIEHYIKEYEQHLQSAT
jgi:hypothetical protein